MAPAKLTEKVITSLHSILHLNMPTSRLENTVFRKQYSQKCDVQHSLKAVYTLTLHDFLNTANTFFQYFFISIVSGFVLLY